MMSCCVRRPQQCKAMIVYEGKVYGWQQVDVPKWGLLSFCPEHHESAQHALTISEEYEQRNRQRNDRIDGFYHYLTGRWP